MQDIKGKTNLKTDEIGPNQVKVIYWPKITSSYIAPIEFGSSFGHIALQTSERYVSFYPKETSAPFFSILGVFKTKEEDDGRACFRQEVTLDGLSATRSRQR